MKILFIVLDGLGDKPIKKLNNKTPLESAKTPNLDYLAKEGMVGLMEPCFTAALPTSEEGHFSLFGYSPKVFKVKRGIFTASGAGMKLKKGDVALRGNFGTVDENLNMIDRRA
jgi:2,3-bisphosphoglycerate-independent phosphoglycerate mutase